MKSLLKVINLKNSKDSKKIREIISLKEGIIAYEINLTKKEIQIVYDGSMVSIRELVDIIEMDGFIVDFEESLLN